MTEEFARALELNDQADPERFGYDPCDSELGFPPGRDNVPFES